jgi:signal peptidase I
MPDLNKLPAEMQPRDGWRGAAAIPIISDNMEPTLRRGDFVLAAPVDRYDGEGIYVFDVRGDAVVYRACGFGEPGTVHLSSDNRLYSVQSVSKERFEGVVLGKVAATVNVTDRRMWLALGGREGA